jgi:hypothetical protein
MNLMGGLCAREPWACRSGGFASGMQARRAWAALAFFVRECGAGRVGDAQRRPRDQRRPVAAGPGIGRGAAYVFQRRPDGSWRRPPSSSPTRPRPATGPTTSAGLSIPTASRRLWARPARRSAGAPDTGAAHLYDLGCLLCRVDLDGDGELTFFDFLAFEEEFAAGWPRRRRRWQARAAVYALLLSRFPPPGAAGRRADGLRRTA